MRKEKALISVLRGLVDLLAEESARNPEFALRIERLLSDLPATKVRAQRPAAPKLSVEKMPDIHVEWKARGATDFRLWMQELPIPVLRALIRTHDLDPTRRSAKWKDAEKLAAFIADSLVARLSRGSAFMGRETME